MIDATNIRSLLENTKLKITIDSPDNSYYFEYFSTASINKITNKKTIVRTYRLIDRIRNQVTSEPWDAYDLEKQTTLVTNLIAFGRYRITKISAGWQATCPKCGQITQHEHWQKQPKQCKPESDIANKCHTKFKPINIKELTYPVNISL